MCNIELRPKQTHLQNQAEDRDIFIKALEDIQIIAAAWGTKAPLIHEMDKPRYATSALNSIYNIATTALREK